MAEQSIKDRIDEKIVEIEKFISELHDLTPLELDFEKYKCDLTTKAIFERYSEKIIEAIEDLAFLIVNYKKLKYPEEEKEIFDTLKKSKIIPDVLSERLKNAKGMRNVIAHQYGKIDDEVIFNSVTEEIEKDSEEFIRLIRLSVKAK